jgi:nucleotide sugar dehydrogenase
MSTSILDVKSEEIDSFKKRGKYRVSTIGCRKNGAIHACLFAEAGFKVTCVDVNRVIVEGISKGRSPYLPRRTKSWLRKHVRNGRLKATNDIKQAVSESDVIVITTSVKIDRKRSIGHLEIEKICKQVGLALRQGSLVIVMSAVRPGTTDGLISETLENVSGLRIGYHFGLAYSPVPFLKEGALEKSMSRRRIVAARDKSSLEAASTVIETITEDGVIRTDDTRAAEAARLFTSIQYCINTASANELALLCEKEGMDYFQIQKLAQTDAYGACARPSIGFQSMCDESHLLFSEAEKLKTKLRITATAIDINQQILRHAVDLIKTALRSCGKSLRTAKISLIGISRTIDAKDVPKPSILKLAKTLEAKGGKVSFYDPYLSGKRFTDSGCQFKRRLRDAMTGVDCVVISTGHSRFKRLSLKKLKVLGKMPVAVVDLQGIIDPEKVEEKGLIYRGLGRGVWKK